MYVSPHPEISNRTTCAAVLHSTAISLGSSSGPDSDLVRSDVHILDEHTSLLSVSPSRPRVDTYRPPGPQPRISTKNASPCTNSFETLSSYFANWTNGRVALDARHSGTSRCGSTEKQWPWPKRGWMRGEISVP